MPSFRYQLFILFVAGLCIVRVKSEICFLSLPSDPALRPIFERTFGSRTILRPYKSLKESNNIYAEKGETIILHCLDGFSLPSNLADRASIKLTCVENGIFEVNNKHLVGDWSMYRPHSYSTTTTHRNYPDLRNLYFECKKLGWTLYESAQVFRWCPEYTASYIIAKKNVNKSPTPLAGLCYDTGRFSLSSVAYNIQPEEFKISKTTFDFSNYSLGNEIKHFQSIEDEGLTPLLFEDKLFEDWFTFGNFHYAPLAENIKLKDITQKFSSLLNVTWWSNLRLGNWKKYRNALEKHTIKAAYNVISGIGGKLEVPDSSGCDNTTDMKVLVDKYDRHIPAYIWNYLEPIENTSKEFAIIAFNSPFYEFYEEGDIVFCEDICHKITWLANVRSTFRYANMGVMFCCELDDVQKSARLDNFPKKNDTGDVPTRI
ncbi:uncharacterized protein LOC119633774 [Glossina fuscipes]|uniref:Uncharacterized protein LOC119633774 n=1 Tax=Glossina fuscipes TaxID=7396 RepID=A0A8U0WEZ5_9MUSC|nr:uncharacterized protein LOC119633774 [Glossina fuscipes]XP_037883440.1 uncharacterized protein LOC119633774 [Glossina fuscipes]